MDRQMQPSGKGFVRRLAVLLGSAALLLPLAAEPVRQHTSAAALYLLTMAATTMATPAQAQTAPRITSIELVGDANPLTTVTELKWRVTFNQTVQNQTATFNWQVSGAGVSSVTVTQRRIDGSNWGTSNGIALDRSNRWEVTASGTFQPGTVTLSLNTPSRVFPEGSSFNDADQLTNTTPTGTSQPTFTLYQSVVSITADETEIQEGDAVSYTLRRTGDTTDSLTVQLFVDRSGVTFDPPITGLVPVTFPATQDTVTTTLQTADDETYSPGSEGLIGASIFSDTRTPALYRSTSGTFADAVTVTDDDPPPVVTLGLSPSTIDEDGGTSMVTATLDRPSATGIDIDVSLEPGAPASLGSQNLLIIQGGNTEVVQLFDTNGNPISPVTITATDNDVDAPDVTVEVRGTVRNRGEIENPNPVTLTITDDDPGVVAIVRADPDTSPTNATRVTWNIFFSEVLDPDTVSNFDFKVDVDGAEIADEDFFVGKQEITDAFFNNEQGIFYLVTVDVRNVLDDLNGSTVTLNFDPNQGITSANGNPLVDTTPTGANDNTFIVDNTAPTPVIMMPATSDRPFIATIEFDEPVTGFQESSITVGNAMLSGFTEVTQGEVWSVLVTPTATGAVTLSLTADSVQDATENGNVAAQASSTYTAPAAGTTVSGQEIWSATLTARGLAGGSAGCTRTGFGAIKCSDPSTLSDTDFILNGDTHTIFSMGFSNTESRIDITPGLDEDFRGDSYTITFDGGTEIPVGVISDGSRFSNSMLGVALSNGQDYTLKLFRTPADDIAPTVTSIVRQDPTTATTNADSLTWRVTFDEAVVNVDAADFTLEGTTATLSVEAVDGETGVYDVTASGGDLAELDDTVTLSFASGQNIADAAGNALTNTEPTVDEATYQVDNVPTVKSIIRLTPPTSPTDADSLTWRVTFSEAVENFTADDFTLTGTTAVITNVEEVSGETGVFDVTASGGNLADVNGTVTLGFATTQDIEDASGNALANTAPTDTDDTSFDVDNIPPTVEITDVPGTSSRAFTATISFSEPVTGSEIGTGFAIGDITAVNGMLSEFTETTPGTVWTVRVTPTASGTVRLSVAADAVRDDAGNPNTASNTASSTYTAPLSISVSGTEIWSATLNAQSTGLDTLGCNTANFSPAKRCSTAAALSDNDFILDDNTYTITIIGYTSSLSDFDIITEPSLAESLRDDEYVLTIDGTEVPLDYGRSTVSTTFKFSNSNIDLDLTSGQDYALKLFRADTTPPAVTSITRLTPEASVTNADQLTWRVTFSEVVANVDAADFQVDGTTTSLSVTGSGATWDVTATGGDLADLNGTVTLEFASGQDIANAKGNVLADTAPTGTNENNYMLDNTAPTPTITGVPQGSYRPFTAAITFSEPVTGFVIGDITATNATLSQFSETTSDTVWTVQVAPIADGQVTLNIAASVATDAGNNGNTAANASSTYTAPTPPPGIEIWSGTLTVRQLNAFSLGCSISSATTTNRCSDSSTLTDDDFELGGVDYDIVLLNRVTIQATDNFQLRVAPALPDAFDATALAVTVDGQVLTVTRTDVQDLNTNALSTQLKKSSPGFTWTAGQEVEVKLFYYDVNLDMTPPAVTSVERLTPATSPTNGDSLTWRVTFSEAVENVDAADFGVSGTTATLTDVQPVSGETGVYDVTASGGDLADLSGTVTLGFASGQDIEDAAGNALTATMPTGANDNAYVVDNTAPTWQSITRQDPMAELTDTDTLTWRLTFSEAVGPVTAEAFDARDTDEAVIPDVTLSVAQAPDGTSDVWDVTAAGTGLVDRTGPVVLRPNATFLALADAAGNILDITAIPAPNETAYTLDNTPPMVSIADGSPVEEGTPATFTLSRTGPTTSPLTVNVSVMGTGDVLAGTAPTSITFGAGDATATLSVMTQDNDIDEADRTITATVEANSATPATYELGTDSQATVTVTDNDTRDVVVSGSPLTVNEGGTGFYTVVLMSRPTGEVTIMPSSDNTDVTVSPTTLIFTADNWNVAQPVTVTAADDDAITHTATITHTVAGADYGANSVSASDVMVTVSEIFLPIVTIMAGTSPVSEGTAAAFTLTRTGGDATNALMVNVTMTQNGNVLSGTAPTSVTFNAGATTAPLSIPTDDDNVDEDSGMVTATVDSDGANPTYLVLREAATATVMVEDNDSSPVVTLLLSPDTITEAAGVSEIRAMLSNPSAEETRVTVFIPPEVTGAVELDANPVLLIPAGMTASSNAVTLTAVDNEAEAPDLSVTLSGVAENTLGVTGPEPVTLTITDDKMLTTTDDETPPLEVNPLVEADTTAPRVASIERQPPDASPTNADSLTWRVTFSEAVTNVDAADFTVSGTTAMVTNVAPVGGEPLAHDVTISGGDLAGFNGTVMLGFASDQNIADGANNPLNTTRPTGANDNSYMVDNTAPTVAITDVPATSTAPFTATITFNEVVSGFTVAGITVSNATLSAFSEATTGTVWTVRVTPEMDGPVTLGIGANVAMDAAGNGNTAATQARSIYTAPDMMAPTVGIDVPATSTAPFTATITFSEMVSGFTVADIMVSNATLSDFTEATTGAATPGTIWTVLVTPEMDGPVTLEIAAGGAENAAGTSNTAAPQARSIYTAPDMMAPTVGIDVPATSTAPFTATITFSEMVSGFTVADITVSNATLSAFTEATPGTVWTVLVTPEMDGPVTLDIAAGGAENTAGTSNTAAPQARSIYAAPAMETDAKEEAEAVLEEVVLPDLIQQLTTETTEVITSRLNSIASGLPSAPLTLSLEEVVADTVAFFHGEQEHLKNGSLDWRQALSGRDFVWPLSSLSLAQGESAGTQDDHPFSTLALWGGGNTSSYSNIIKRTDVDGNGFSAVIGMDLQPIPRLTTGLALTTSRWGLDYATEANAASAEGTYEIGVTMVHPYVNWSATEQLSLWATFGYGRGEVAQDPEDGNGTTTRTDDLITSWAGGVRFEVVPAMNPLTGEGSPFGLAFKADGATSSFLDTQVQLARLAAEVSHAFAVENGLLTAALELGWRIRSVSGNDDLDVQQQAIAEENHSGGAELAGRLHWLNANGSLSATVDTRVLLQGGHHREWGMGGHLRFTPSRRDGEGLSLTLQPSFGVTGTKLDALWSLSGNGDLAVNNDPPGARLDARLAYGFPLANAILTPYTEVAWEEGGSTYGAGLRYGLSPALELDLKGARHHPADGNTESLLLLDVRSHL